MKSTAHLNIFLIRNKFKDIDQIIDEEKYDKYFEVQLKEHRSGKLIVKKSLDNYPRWTKLFQESIDVIQIGTVNNVSAILLLKVESRYFALSFGQGGRFILKNNTYEERFGLIVTLNSIDKESLRCIDKQSLDTIDSHSRIQSAEGVYPPGTVRPLRRRCTGDGFRPC